MRRLHCVIALLALSALVACATQPPRYRNQAILSLERARKGGAGAFFPAEFASAAQSFQIGEELLKAREEEDAERYYDLALIKSELLEKEAAKERARRKDAERKAEEARKAEQARQAEEEARREAAAEEERLKREEAETLAAQRKAKQQREQLHTLVSRYTVRRGESLPLIASHAEVYGDRNLWPLLYRANRDQIRDPRHIWPGQVLRIPRNLGRDEIAEARRYAQDRPLR